MVKPKGIRTPGLKGYKTGADGFTGVSVTLTTVSTAKNEISEEVKVEVDQGLKQTITESVIVSIT